MKKIILLLLLVMPFLGFSQTDTSKKQIDSLEEVEETPVFVEALPEYPGGNEAMYKFIGRNLKYPKKARKEGIEGKVFIRFVVDKEGNVTKAKVIRGIGFGCDEEALRVVNKMPKWKPGMQRGKPVSVAFTLPFNFKLK